MSLYIPIVYLNIGENNSVLGGNKLTTPDLTWILNSYPDL